MSFIAARQSVDVYRQGDPVKDRFGNLTPGVGVWESSPVAQWWVHRSEETDGDSVLRTVDLLTVHFPAGSEPAPSSKVRLPDGTEWQVEGNAENYDHGFHGWAPGLVVVHCKRVEG